MSSVLEVLNAWDGEGPLDLDALGGENALWASRAELVDDERLAAVVATVCADWDRLTRPDEARTFVLDAAAHPNSWVAEEVLDVVLSSADALPHLGPALVDLLRVTAQSADLRGDVALEGWTRLALGRWCSALPLQGALVDRAAQVSTGQVAASVYLVRALGAAMDMWRVEELRDALTKLTDVDDVSDQALFELGLSALADAASAPDPSTARDHLAASSSLLEQARELDDRADAAVFATAVDLLSRFSSGSPLTLDDAEQFRATVTDYLLGYLGEQPHWRQPRADTAARWIELVTQLSEFSSDAGAARDWWPSQALIHLAAQIYRSHRTLSLLVRADAGVPAAEARPEANLQAVSSLLEPVVVEGLAAAGANVALVDLWLQHVEADALDAGRGRGSETVNERSAPLVRPEDVTAVRALRERLRAREVVTGPKADPPVDELAPTLADLLVLDPAVNADLIADLRAVPGLLPRLERQAEMRSLLPGPSAEQQRLLNGRLSQIREIAPDAFGRVSAETVWLVEQLIRFASLRADQRRGSDRAPPWLRRWTKRKDAPHESLLADDLALFLSAVGQRAYVEVNDIGGGRVDIVVLFGRVRFVIEVKREFDDIDVDGLVAMFGAQTTQYANTELALGFLAVLDLAERKARLDVDSCLQVRSYRLPQSARTCALTVLRVVANADNPSASSR